MLTPFGWRSVSAHQIVRRTGRSTSKFSNSLPIPTRIDATGGSPLHIQMKATAQDLLGSGMPTPVWGYGPAGSAVSYPGPTLVARRDVTTEIAWTNELRAAEHLLPVDTSVHIANPTGDLHPDLADWIANGVPVVPHLHGGHTESASDGLPEAWWTPGEAQKGAIFEKSTYTYHNDQEAGTLWYHDHALGITRLNVYAGLAGFYLLRDDNEDQLVDDGALPGGDYEIEIVIQDRMFTNDGYLYYPSRLDEFYGEEELEEIYEEEPYPAEPSVLPEFFGDTILVNGKAWPHLEVEPRKYRFRLLNGADSRFFVLELRAPDDSGPFPFMQIGTDDGLLDRPCVLSRLLMGPGERADVVVDFARFEGSSLVLRNFGPDEPFKGFDAFGESIGGPADPYSTGLIMRFDVNQPLDLNAPDASLKPGTRLRDKDDPVPQWKQFEKQATTTRRVALFEGSDEYGRLQPLLGTAEPTLDVDGETQNGSLAWFDAITENPSIGEVEVWEVYNATEDAHPVHLHLVPFLVLDRQPFTATVSSKPQPSHDGGWGEGGVLSNITLMGAARRPEPNEWGWKDTVVAFPGEVTRIAARFDRPGRYVWHCHILSHEDHEMMRPYYVGPIPQIAAAGAAEAPVLHTASPNPFSNSTTLRFELQQPSHVRFDVYDVTGRRVARLLDETVGAGPHSVSFDGSRLASGLYIGRLTTSRSTVTTNMMLVR